MVYTSPALVVVLVAVAVSLLGAEFAKARVATCNIIGIRLRKNFLSTMEFFYEG